MKHVRPHNSHGILYWFARHLKSPVVIIAAAGLLESQGTDLLMGNRGFGENMNLSGQMSGHTPRLALKRMKVTSLVILAAGDLTVCSSYHQR